MGFLTRFGRCALVAAVLATALTLLPRPALAATLRGDVDSAAVAFGNTVTGVEPFAMIGLSWQGSSTTPPQLEVVVDGAWQRVDTVEVEDDVGPDETSAEATKAERVTGDERFTEAAWVDAATGYRVAATPGVEAATVHLIRTETVMVPTLDLDAAGAAPAPADGPAISPRSAWGAAAPTGSASIAPTISMAVVHHTATSNDYTQAQVPSIILSMQTYHQQRLGWNDIGYNFLVDKYGGIWEGRAGGIGNPVVGAHAAGFNTGSVGVSVIGDYSGGGASDVAVAGVAAVIGWKFALHGVAANGTTTVLGSDANKFPNGQTVTLPTIVGHRDVGSTDCPGQISAQLAHIRSVAAQRSPVARGHVDSLDVDGTDTVRAAGWGVDTRSGDAVKIAATRNGSVVAETTTAIARPDISAQLPGVNAASGFTLSVPLTDGNNRICIYVRETTYGATTLLSCGDFATRNNPSGRLESVELSGGSIRLRGWADDPNTYDPIPIHIYVNGVSSATTNGVVRPDIWALDERRSYYTGFDATVPVSGDGPFDVCAYGINVGPGSQNVSLGCQRVGYDPNPIGEFVIAVNHQGKALVGGWALDPDSPAPVTVMFFNNGRPSFAAPAMHHWDALIGRFPNHGTSRLFFALGPLNRGRNEICAYAVNIGPGHPATPIGCQVVHR